ncbi:hypothetical protein J4225_02045 [Candidatus Pacearchaeota archaeon]|nr:hypothetical protein [Candidatus Pacearchaeota archaeon]
MINKFDLYLNFGKHKKGIGVTRVIGFGNRLYYSEFELLSKTPEEAIERIYPEFSVCKDIDNDNKRRLGQNQFEEIRMGLIKKMRGGLGV